jgi:type I restriction enzyme S subunit
LGKVGLNTIPVAFNQQINAISPDENRAVPRFMFYQVLSCDFKDQLEAMSSGTTVPIVNKSRFNSIKVVLPPLPEQQRIVALLDEAFAGLATAKANAERNLKNARAIFVSHLDSVFTQRGEGWAEKPFEELIESNVIGLTKNSHEQGKDKAWPYMKMNNITRDNRLDFSSFTCVEATNEEVFKYSLKEGDFLFNTRNSHELVGKSCVYESAQSDTVLYNNNIMRVRFLRGFDAKFILLAFSSKGVSDELNALKSGTTNVSAIYFKDLKTLTIPVPSIAEQKMITAELNDLSKETQRLTRLYERKLAALEELKKSLLHQAFNGEL